MKQIFGSSALATFSSILILVLALVGEALAASPSAVLEDAFGKGAVGKVSLIVTAKEAAEVQRLARTPFKSGVYRGYVHSSGGVGVLIVRRVRTKSMAALYVIDSKNSIDRIEILSFLEPPEYEPEKDWLAGFRSKNAADPIQLNNDVSAVSGATLTVRSVTRSSRVALHLAQLMRKEAKK